MGALPAADPVGPSLNQAAVGLAGLALAAKIAEDECDDVGIEDGLCAVLYDEQKCKRSADFLSLRPGDSGVLPLISTGLIRDLRKAPPLMWSLIVHLASPWAGTSMWTVLLTTMTSKILMRRYLLTGAPVVTQLSVADFSLRL